LEFIAGAEKGEQAPLPQELTKPPKRRKEPVIIRFDAKTLQQIDQVAEKRGLSRAADAKRKIIDTAEVACDTDEQAVAAARDQAYGGKIEIWRGTAEGRRVRAR
jgi:hypothetical protein